MLLTMRTTLGVGANPYSYKSTEWMEGSVEGSVEGCVVRIPNRSEAMLMSVLAFQS
jgi:hypothetical protein